MRLRTWGAAIAVMVALGGLSGGVAQADPASPAVSAAPEVSGRTAGADWTVTRRGQGDTYTVKLRLPKPVPIRAALPQIAVDGRVVGFAERAADGHTLTLRTSDAWVAKAERVQLAWNGKVAGQTSQKFDSPSEQAVSEAPAGPLLADDPAAPGPYKIERADYDLGDSAVRLPGLGGQAVEMRAAAYLPKGAEGARPVAIFLHGMHDWCYGEPKGGNPAFTWPCTKGMKPVPSHLGYDAPAKALASNGYAVISISANGVNAALYETARDAGAQARGDLVLAHLDQLRRWTSDEGNAFSGRLDLSNVGLMGHSRGGEGVVAAALANSARPSPYGIRAVLPLAPTDFSRATLPGAAMAVILPYCDGDVSDQQGQRYYDDTRYSGPDDVLRTVLVMMGANHNFFNTEWTPSTSKAGAVDDWFDRGDPVCGSKAPGRLSPRQQRAAGAAYIAGFFRLNLGDEQQFLPLFDGTDGRAKSAGPAVVHTQAQQPSSARTDLATFSTAKSSVTTSKAATYCTGTGARPAGSKQPPTCSKSNEYSPHHPHWVSAYFAPDVPTTSVLRLKWTSKTKAGTLASVNTRPTTGREALTFRAATQGGKADLKVTVTDRAGAKATVSVARFSNALKPLPKLYDSAKVIMRTVRIPLTAFSGVDPSSISRVSFARASERGDVVLSDLALDTPASVTGGPTGLPSASVGDQVAFESDRSQRVRVPVTLSRPSRVPVVVNISTDVTDTDARVPTRWIRVVVPAGKTKTVAEFRMRGNQKTEPLARLDVTLSAPKNAVVGDGWGILTVYDDDEG